MFHLFRKNAIFSKNIEPHCAYCAHCEKDTEYQGICEFRGIVALAGSCRRFRYDPFKRIPAKAKAMDFTQYDDMDYSL